MSMNPEEWEEPYLDRRYRPPKWIGGEPLPKKSPDHPVCPKCGYNDRVELLSNAVVNSDGMYTPARYRCWRCDNIFRKQKF